MKRIVRLTESDLTRIVRRVINESRLLNEGSATLDDICQASGSYYNEEACETFGHAKTLQEAGKICYNQRKGIVDILRKNLEKYATQSTPISQAVVDFFESEFKDLDMISYIGLSYAIWNNGIGGTSYDSISDVINVMLPCRAEMIGKARAINYEIKDHAFNNNRKNATLQNALTSVRDQVYALGIFDKINYVNGCASARAVAGTFG